MKYILTEEQFEKLWKEDFYYNREIFLNLAIREALFKDKFGDKLTYSDSSDPYLINYYGAIEGNEKDINWFLLQL